MEKIKLTNELHNRLVEQFSNRSREFGLKGKRKLEAQADFFCGAMAAIDGINGGEESCCTPGIFFKIIRGELIEKIKEEQPSV